jgi:hypothetical protein
MTDKVSKKAPSLPPKEMLAADSDKYFAEYVVPLFKKAEMSKLLKPLGLAPRGKGSLDRKRKQVMLIVDRVEGRSGPQVLYLNGSHYTKGDGQWNISMKHWSGWTEEFVEKFKGSPKRDAAAMQKGVRDMMKQMVDLEAKDAKVAGTPKRAGAPEWAKGKTFPHPKTKNKVQWGSLPADEQAKLRKKHDKGGDKDKGDGGSKKYDSSEHEDKANKAIDALIKSDAFNGQTYNDTAKAAEATIEKAEGKLLSALAGTSATQEDVDDLWEGMMDRLQDAYQESYDQLDVDGEETLAEESYQALELFSGRGPSAPDIEDYREDQGNKKQAARATMKNASTAKKATLRKKLIRLAHDHPEKRAQAMRMVVKLSGDKMPPELLEKFKGKKDDKKAADKTQFQMEGPARALAKEKGVSYGWSLKTRRWHVGTPAELKKFNAHPPKDKKKEEKKAGISKQAINKETDEFTRWVLSTQAPMSPSEVETFVKRTLGIKTSKPRTKPSGPRFQRGMSVLIDVAKHKMSKYDIANYKRFNGKIGTVTELVGPMDILVAFKGEPAPILFPGAQERNRVGIGKYTAPYTVDGSAKIEMLYYAGGKPTKDAVIIVEAYIGRGGETEQRSSSYYTGHVTFASIGKKGYYFMGFPQQRMPMGTEAGYRPTSFNPAVGKVFYIGLFGKRPNNWKADLAKMDAQFKVEEPVAEAS